MKDAKSAFETDLAGLDPVEWIDRLEDVAEDFGFFEPLGPRHSAAFITSGARLMVSFQSSEEARTSPRGEPIGFHFTRREGWSSLTFVCDGPTWFRHRAIYQYMDRLIDRGFFDEFDDVLFYGTGPAGYAAAAYSVAAPGAHVLLIRPQATLDPGLAGWDSRYVDYRRADFSSRYGFAPDMVEAAARAWVVFDPYSRLDAMHAALFRRVNVTYLRTPLLTATPERDLAAMGLIQPMMRSAMEGRLNPLSYGEMLRTRRSHLPYLRRLVALHEQRGRPGLVARVCRHATRDKDRKFFSRRLEAPQAVSAG